MVDMHKEINKIRAKMTSAPWPKYVSSLKIDGLRGWTGEEIRFDFPVCAVAGENGSGKSTILKALACAYASPKGKSDTFYPSTFFPDTAWDSVSDAELTFKIKENSEDRNFIYRKKKMRWRYHSKRSIRNIIIQDISRTLPIDATVGYAKLAKKVSTEVSATSLTPVITAYYSSIMGRSYSEAKFAISNLDSKREVGVVISNKLQFSQFHQGAGEDATLDLMALLQGVADTSLVLIDEVEASLHPRSQRRLIHFLLWLARTKQLQIILTTHSKYILEELPPEARIYIERKNRGREVIYNVSPNFALNRMDDIDKPDLFVFVEDEESATLIKCLLRFNSIDITRIKFIDIGPANIVSSIGIASYNPRFPVNAVGVLDADQEDTDGCIKLPGNSAPEKQIITDILEKATLQLSTRLELSEESIKSALDKTVAVTEHHDWPKFLARLTGQTQTYIWETLCNIWVKHCLSLDEVIRISDFISNKLPETEHSF